MARGELKTQRTNASVEDFIDGLTDERRRKDSRRLLSIMKEATGAEPEMWGPAIVGFGSYRYETARGKLNDWFLAGFSPRKQYLALYLMAGYSHYAKLLKRLGEHSRSVSCLYIKTLDAVDEGVLRELIATGAADLSKQVTSSD
ncbi:MAG TPA: DUF1801 domain-containing protein [Gemmatimonadaceae bacterium]|nr:DUF1801 domain-containing protein [Gemmatimonadaceae bacterium]